MTDAEKQAVVEKYLSTSGGRAKLAAAMVSPLRTRRDYVSIGGAMVPTDARFICRKCGMWSDSEAYEHTEEECTVAYVILS